MKKYVILAVSLLGIGGLYAQDIHDALRYSQNGIYGDARYTGMSGAFGALGGTLSAINDNPAAGAVFLNDKIDFSLLVGANKVGSDFNGTSRNGKYTDFQIANAGINLVYDYWDESSVWNKFSVGANFKLDNAYGYNGSAQGVNNYSLSDYFVEIANGIELDLLNLRDNESYADLYSYLGEVYGSNAQTAFLGYQGYLIDPVDPEDSGNTQYISNVTGNSFDQRKTMSERGYQGTFTFNLGAQLIDDLYLGLNLNSHILDYERTDVFEEIPQDENSPVSYAAFAENLKTYGSGFSAQLGAIYRLDNGLRFGLTYTTPKWIKIEEKTRQSIESEYFDGNNWQSTLVNPNIVNVYEEYTLRTPGKIGASAAYVFGNSGLISLQYDYTDNSNITFKPRNYTYFGEQNDIIKDALQASSSVRLGGEYNVSFVSFRGGLHYVESPYKDSDMMSDAKGFSLGLGFKFEGVALDLAYLQSAQESKNLMLLTNDAMYNYEKTQRNFVVSVGIDF